MLSVSCSCSPLSLMTKYKLEQATFKTTLEFTRNALYRTTSPVKVQVQKTYYEQEIPHEENKLTHLGAKVLRRSNKNNDVKGKGYIRRHGGKLSKDTQCFPPRRK